MKNKFFKTEEGTMFYQHYTGRDLFDIEQFPLKDGKKWRDIIGTKGQNAERKAIGKACTAFTYAMKLLMDELIEKECYISLGIYKMGHIGKKIVETEKISPETFNKKAVLYIAINEEFRRYIGKSYNIRMTKKGRIKLFNTVKVKKRGTVSKH